MDMVRRGCFGVAAVVFLLGAVRLLFATGTVLNNVAWQGQVATQEFDLLRTLIECGIAPTMIGAGLFCLAMAIPYHETIKATGFHLREDR